MPTRNVFAFMPAADGCGEYCQRLSCLVDWSSRCWWRPMVLTLGHDAQFRATFEETGLPIYLGPDYNHPLSPTIIARRNHGRRILDGTQHLELDTLDLGGTLLIMKTAAIQSRTWNKVIGSEPISSIIGFVQHSRPGAEEGVRRMSRRFPAQLDSSPRCPSSWSRLGTEAKTSVTRRRAWRASTSGRRPTPGILKLASLYKSKATGLRALGNVVDDKGQPIAGSASARMLADYLEAGVKMAESWDQEGRRSITQPLHRVAKIIEGMFNMSFEYNDEELPTGSFPKKTPSDGLFTFCAKVFLRGEDDCDESQQERCGRVIPRKKTDWWRAFVMWLLHYAQYRELFAEERLPIDISGFPFQPLAANLARSRQPSPLLLRENGGPRAREAGIRRLVAANACLQSWRFNKMIRKTHVAVINANVQHARGTPRSSLRGSLAASPSLPQARASWTRATPSRRR